MADAKLEAVNNFFLVEPILRMSAETERLRKRVAGTGLLIPDAKPNNRETFEGMPNQGHIRYLPAGYAGELWVGQHVLFREDSPQGFEFEGVKLFPLKEKQIVGWIPE